MRRWQRQRVLFPWLLVLSLLMLGYGEAALATQSPRPKHAPQRRASRYTVVLQAPSATFQHQATEVSVRVQTSRGQPLDGVPVEFLLHPVSRHHAVLSPGRTLTRDGQARAILRAQRIGIVHLTARVGALRKHAEITILLPVASLHSPVPGPEAALRPCRARVLQGQGAMLTQARVLRAVRGFQTGSTRAILADVAQRGLDDTWGGGGDHVQAIIGLDTTVRGPLLRSWHPALVGSSRPPAAPCLGV